MDLSKPGTSQLSGSMDASQTDLIKLYEEAAAELENIQKLLNSSQTISLAQRIALRNTYNDLIPKAGHLKELAEENDPRRKVSILKIPEDGVGFSYTRIFASHLDSKVKHVDVFDPYIRSTKQVRYFEEFCLMLSEKCINLTDIYLETKLESDQISADSQIQRLNKLKDSLKSKNITINVAYDPNAHDRGVFVDNGWSFYLLRGFDIFKSKQADQSLRKCRSTSVIYIFRPPF